MLARTSVLVGRGDHFDEPSVWLDAIHTHTHTHCPKNFLFFHFEMPLYSSFCSLPCLTRADLSSLRKAFRTLRAMAVLPYDKTCAGCLTIFLPTNTAATIYFTTQICAATALKGASICLRVASC